MNGLPSERRPLRDDRQNHTPKSMNTEVGVKVGRVVALMAVHVLLLRACAYVTLHGRVTAAKEVKDPEPR